MLEEQIDKLAQSLAPHYSRFDVANRLLFTGHSHQAWPDCAMDGYIQSFDQAATLVDNKWEQAFQKTESLRNYLRSYYDDPHGRYCLGPNTHQLLVALLSSFDLAQKPKIITTSGEFHSMYRQLRRASEEGLEPIFLDTDAPETLPDRIEQELDDRTSAIALSRVYFETGLIQPQLTRIASLARQAGVPLIIDDYHGTNVIPLSIQEAELKDCFMLIGGYKYLQWGEANCFLRFPQDCQLRPAITGWFASFSTLDQPRSNQSVAYDDGDQRFASGTYDPVSQYRAAQVVDFFGEHELSPQRLRKQYLSQLELMRAEFQRLDLDPELIRLAHTETLERNGGFLALRSTHARTLRANLLDRGVYTDARGEILRFGPAPYIQSQQIKDAMLALRESAAEI
ncbi:MAG: aminotransferase class V-fold PLP-dependent enzyme [Bacteroidota bacterium]